MNDIPAVTTWCQAHWQFISGSSAAVTHLLHQLWGHRGDISAWMDSRNGGLIQKMYYGIFGKPISGGTPGENKENKI